MLDFSAMAVCDDRWVPSTRGTRKGLAESVVGEGASGGWVWAMLSPGDAVGAGCLFTAVHSLFSGGKGFDCDSAGRTGTIGKGNWERD
jgi:hypothetical protein